MRRPVAQGSGAVLLGLVWRAVERWTVIDAIEKTVPALHSVVFSHTVQGMLIGAGVAWILADWLASKPNLSCQVHGYDTFNQRFADRSESKIALWLEISNAGHRGIVTTWSLVIKTQDGSTIKATPAIFDSPVTIPYREGQNRVYDPVDALPNKVMAGVEKGIPVRGFVLFHVPLGFEDYLTKKGTVLRVGILDTEKKWSYCKYEVTGTALEHLTYLPGTTIPKPPSSSFPPNTTRGGRQRQNMGSCST